MNHVYELVGGRKMFLSLSGIAALFGLAYLKLIAPDVAAQLIVVCATGGSFAVAYEDRGRKAPQK